MMLNVYNDKWRNFFFLCIFWNDVLTRLNTTSKYNMKEDADLQEIVSLLNSLEQYLPELRD